MKNETSWLCRRIDIGKHLTGSANVSENVYLCTTAQFYNLSFKWFVSKMRIYNMIV